MSSAKGKMSEADKINEKFSRRVRARTDEQEKTEESASAKKFENIEANPFYQLMVAEGTPEEKKALYEKNLVADATKTEAENRAIWDASEEFKDWLAEHHKQNVKELIHLSDTKGYALLQSVIDEMNSSMLEFETLIDPMMEVIKAIHTLNKESGGLMYEVFKEVEADKAEQERIETEKAKLQEQIEKHEEAITRLDGETRALREDKPWYLFGKVRQSSIEAATQKEAEIDRIRGTIADVQDQYKSLKSERETKFAQYGAEKETLARFLNLSSDENQAQQKAVIQAVMNYVETMDSKSASVLDLMKEREAAIQVVDDTSGKMQRAYTIIQDAELGAAHKSSDLAQQFGEAAEDESPLQKMEREKTLDMVNEHVTRLSDSAKVSNKTLLKITNEAVAIKSLKDNNRRAIRDTKELNTSGVASMGQRLITTMESFAAAAMNEGKTTITNTMSVMDKKTLDIMKEDVIQTAAAMHIENDQLAEIIERASEVGEAGAEAIKIQRSALANAKKLAFESNEKIEELKKLVQESKGLDTEYHQDEAAAEQDNRKPSAPVQKPGGLNL